MGTGHEFSSARTVDLLEIWLFSMAMRDLAAYVHDGHGPVYGYRMNRTSFQQLGTRGEECLLAETV